MTVRRPIPDFAEGREFETFGTGDVPKHTHGFLEWLAEHNYSPATVTNRAYAVREFLRFMAETGTPHFQDVRSHHIGAFRKWLVAKRWRHYAVRNASSAVNRLFGYLEERGLVEADPDRKRTFDRRRGRRREPLPLEETVEDFTVYLRQHNNSPATVKSQTNALRRFLRFLAENEVARLRDVDEAVLESYRLELLGQRYSHHTVHRYLTAVTELFDYLNRCGKLFDDPTRELHGVRTPRPLPDVLTEKEVMRLLAMPDRGTFLGLRDRAMLEVLYSTGVRRAELLGMTVFSVDLDTGMAQVTGKGNKDRTVPVGEHACRHLTHYLKYARPRFMDPKHPRGDLLWWSRNRTPVGLQTPPKTIRKYAAQAGIRRRITTHTMRRTCATHMLRGGAHPVVVAQMLGHADMKSLSHYLRVTVTDLMTMHRHSKLGR